MSDKPDIGPIRDQLLQAANSLSVSAKKIDDRLALIQGLAETTTEILTKVQSLILERGADWEIVRGKVAPALEEISRQQALLRSVFMGKIDYLQGTIDLMREDVRTNWQQADFAISNSRDGREDVSKLLVLISSMQRQQNMLAAQVEELRKAAQARDAGLG